jgi:hypothetical protein
MNNIDMINLLKKYKKMCTILNLLEDVNSFDDIISFIETNKTSQNSEKSRNQLRNEDCYYTIISTEEVDISRYNINQEIINNKMDILSYWSKINEKEKEKFTVFELNIIMYLLTKNNNNYIKKEKKKIIMDINITVRNKRTVESYNNINV